MTIDEAIKHCLEVAEKNDGEAEVYNLLAKNHNNTYEKLTASRFYTDCAECAADHRQLAEWLMKLKDLRAEQNDQYVFIHELMSELKEAKRLLKAAVEDINSYVDCYEAHCDECCCSQDNHCHWKHEAEALKLIGEEEGE